MTGFERRKHPRLKVLMLLDLYSRDSLVSRTRGAITDLSLGGVKVETKAKFNLGDTIVLRFKVNEDLNLDIKGKILWAQEGVHTNTYGAEFSDIGFFLKLKLKKYILGQMEGQSGETD